LAALNPDLFKMIDGSTLGDALGRDRMFFNLRKAIHAYLPGSEDWENNEKDVK